LISNGHWFPFRKGLEHMVYFSAVVCPNVTDRL
jgi:hypothetical protein